MKKILVFCVFLIGLLAFSCTSPPDKVNPAPTTSRGERIQVADLQVSTPVMYVQDITVLPVPDTPVPEKGNFLKDNWAALVLALMGFAKIVVNLTPTEADNAIFGLLDNFINMLIPNLKKGGGKFT